MDSRNFQIGPDVYGELLQGCVYERALFTGQQIHARIVKSGVLCAENEYVETKLVIFYAKCDVVEVANCLFQRLSVQNVFSWAAIIGLYSRMGLSEEALLGYCEMIEKGFSPDNFVVPNALKACGALHLTEFGRGIHGYVIKTGYTGCVFVASSLIDMYGKCGDLADARKLFDLMIDKNVVAWNSMIVSYVHNGFNKEAVDLFHDMRVESIDPTRVTVSSFLSASANLAAVEEGKQGHAVGVLNGLELDSILGSSIINFYVKVGLIEDAELAFDRMCKKDAVTWNLLISGYVRLGQIDKALAMCIEMRMNGFRFDSVTLASILSASADICDLKLGKECHCFCIRNNLESDVVVASSIVDMYAKCGKIEYSREVFDSTTKRDLVLWNTMLAAYAELGISGEALKLFYLMQLNGVPQNVISWNSLILGLLSSGQVNEAKDIFTQMKLSGIQPNLVSWTTLISGLARNGLGYEAILAFRQMQEAGIKPTSVSISSALSACTDAASLWHGRALHGYVIRHDLCLSIPIANSLVEMYVKCGHLEKAKEVFGMVVGKELPIYNAMISGYALHGQPVESLALFEQLKKEGLSPDNITFTSVLSSMQPSLEG